MPAFKCVYIFSQGKRGWTETWYFTSTSFDTVSATALAVSTPLIACRSTATILEAIRITQDDVPPNRITRLLSPNIAGSRSGPITVPPAAEGPDVVPSCAFMTARFNDGTKRTVLLRGLNDQDVTRDPFSGAPVPVAALNTALLALGVALQSNGAQIRHFDRTVAGTQIGLVNPDNLHPSELQLTYTAPLGVPLVDGTKVRFTGVPRRDLPFLKGSWRIVRSVIGGFNLIYSAPTGLLLAPANMFVFPLKYVYSSLAPFAAGLPTFQFRDWRTRDTGRPIGAPRGRAPGLRFRR